jgi:hypothetical protein
VAEEQRRTGGVSPYGDATKELQRIAEVMVKERLIDLLMRRRPSLYSSPKAVSSVIYYNSAAMSEMSDVS